MILSHPPRADDEVIMKDNSVNAQAGPSSTTRPVSMLGLGISKSKESQEHWDDDFLFQVSSTSPNRQNGSADHRSRGKSPVPSFNEAGWMDTDVEDGPATGANTEDERPSSGEEDEDVDEGGSGSARKRAKKDWQGFSMEGIVTESPSPPPSSSSPHRLLNASTSSHPPRVPPPPPRPASFGSPSRESSSSNLRPPPPSPGTSYDSERSFVHPSRHSYAPQPFPSPTGNEFPSSPTQTHKSDSQSVAHLAGNGYSLQETYDETPRSGRTRRRLRKRSRVGEEPLGDGSSEEDEGRDVAGGGSGKDTADEGGKDTPMSSSPRQLIARGMSSIQKRLSSTSKPRLPSETPSPPRSPRKLKTTPSTEVHTRPRRISIPLRYTANSNHSDASPSASNATPPLNGSPSGGSPYQRPASAVMGFHLPSRSNSGLASPKIKPKPSSILMPPPPVPSAASRSRPTSVRQVTPLNHPSSQSNTNPDVSSSAAALGGPSFPSEPFKLDKPKGLRRLSSLGRKSHRTTSSVSSIPTKHSPTIATTPLPTLMASPRTSEVWTMPVAFESDLVRSTSTPSVRGVTRRNSLSDLRIPSRVASAQKALRERVGVVREFALKVEDLKTLQTTYTTLRESLVASFTSRASPPPPLLSQNSYSSSQPSFSIRRQSIDQFRSEQGAQALRELELQYSPWWEMAEVLVELGGGTLVDQETRDSNRLSEAGSSYSARERAVTLAGGLDVPMPSTPNGLNSSSTELSTSPLLAGVGPPQASPERWRASTGRSDLSRRQLEVLRTMLETPAPSTMPSLPSGLPRAATTPRNRSYPHGAARSSITLPSPSDSAYAHHPSGSFPSSRTLADDERKGKSSGRRVSRAGVKGIKDFLRSLRLGGDMPGGNGNGEGDDMGMGDGKRSVSDPVSRQRGYSGSGTMSTTAADQSFGSTATRKSPRRPSLASIFRFGGSSSGDRTRSSTRSSSGGGGGKSQSGGSRTDVDKSDADWDRMSIDDPRSSTPHVSTADFGGRTTPLSYRSRVDVPDNASEERTVRSSSSAVTKALRRLSPAPPLPPAPPPPAPPPPTRSNPLPMRSAPASSVAPSDWPSSSSNNKTNGGSGAKSVVSKDGIVELSPENLKPLLEHVKEVEKRCGECLVEMRMLNR